MSMSKNSRRYIYLFLGWIFTGLGFVGAFLPLLPTTPFLLIAVWAFGKSSPKLRRWLFSHPKFGYHLRQWFNHGAIDQRAKILAVTLMAVSVGVTHIMSETFYIPLALSVLLSFVAFYIWTRPNPKAVVAK